MVPDARGTRSKRHLQFANVSLRRRRGDMRGRFTSGRILKAGGWLLLVTILFAAMLALLFSPLPYPPKSKGRLLGSTEFEFMKFLLVALTALFA